MYINNYHAIYSWYKKGAEALTVILATVSVISSAKSLNKDY